jgi:hypothetical protein
MKYMTKGKSKVIPVHAIKQLGGAEAKLLSCLASLVDGHEWLTSPPS